MQIDDGRIGYELSNQKLIQTRQSTSGLHVLVKRCPSVVRLPVDIT